MITGSLLCPPERPSILELAERGSTGCLRSVAAATVVDMSAPTVERSGASRPDAPRGPAEVRAAIAQTSGDLAAWDAFLDKVYAKCVGTGSLDPLVEFLDSSWKAAQMAKDVTRHGVQPRERRMNQQTFEADWLERNGRPFPELD